MGAVCRVDPPELAEMLDYVLNGGKRVRPALVLLAGHLFGAELERLLPMASAVEVLHIATLVHDDAIDNAAVRHGRPTANHRWGDDRAILLGDYLLAQAEEMVACTQEDAVIKGFARAIMSVCRAEVGQSCAAFSLKGTTEEYLERIAGKTASLITLSTWSGGVLGGASREQADALAAYGEGVGIAFQIADDILDFTATPEELGKPVGSDLKEGTLTLPAMLYLERSPGDNPIKRLFNSHGEDEDALKEALEGVRRSGAIEECRQRAQEYVERAKNSLACMPPCSARDSLLSLAEYVVERRR